jgi:hypothetical protein
MSTKNIGIGICIIAGFGVGWIGMDLVRAWSKPADPVVTETAETYGGLTQDEINDEVMRRSAKSVVDFLNLPVATSESSSPAFRAWFGSRDTAVATYTMAFEAGGAPLTANQKAVLAREVVPRVEVILATHWAQNGELLERGSIPVILEPWGEGMTGVLIMAEGRGEDLVH